MKRRPFIATLAIAAALVLGAAPAAAAQPFPAKIDLPSGWMPEGITAGRGTTVYVGSLAGGGIWKGDVRTGHGSQLVPHWGGAATGVEYERRANRLWVAGATTGTVRVYDATSGALLKQYTFSPAGFLNDLVVTRNAVYVTDSNNAWLDVIRLGPGSRLPDAGTMLPLTGITVEPAPAFNANGIVATRGRLIVVDSFVGGLYNVDPLTGAATPISTGGVSVANGDGLELHGNTLYVVRNANQVVEVFRLGGDLTSARPLGELTSTGLSVPTTAAFKAGRLWVVNARFGIPTTDYWVTRLPARP
ncbi:MAG: superoxide dismutase [Chloroflexota bacterium]